MYKLLDMHFQKTKI